MSGAAAAEIERVDDDVVEPSAALREAEGGEPEAMVGPLPERKGDAPFQRDKFRFPHMTIERRIFVDALAIPLAPIGWRAGQWGAFGAVMVPTAALMMPTNPSGDVRFQDWVRTGESETLDDVFVKIPTLEATIGTFALLTVGWIATAVTRDKTVWEITSLMTEATALTHVYHLSLKVALGREGPKQNDGLGIVHGPSFEYLPAGTPSGHAATIAVLTGTVAEYYDSWWIRVPAFLATTYISAGLVYHNQHFVSDVIWGAGLGYSTAHWIVRNRSSKYRYGYDRIEKNTLVLPYALPGAAGVMMMGSF